MNSQKSLFARRTVWKSAWINAVAALFISALVAGCSDNSNTVGSVADQVPDNQYLFFIRGFSNQSLGYINLTTGEVKDSVVAIGPAANDLEVRNGKIYVVSSGSGFNGTNNSLQIIRLIDLVSPVRPVPVKTVSMPNGLNPYDLCFISDSKGYVSNLLDSSISVFDAGSETFGTKIRVGTGPEGLAFSNGKLYAAQAYNPATFVYDSTVTVINTATDAVIGTIAVRLNPQSIRADAQGRLHVVCTGNYGFGVPPVFGAVSVINPATDAVVGVAEVGASPSSVVFAPNRTGILDNGDFTSSSLVGYDSQTLATGSLTPVVSGGSLEIAADRLYIGQTGRITVRNADTLDSLTSYSLTPNAPYNSLAVAASKLK